MPETTLHHVVFCVRPENQDQAAAYWRDLGLTFQEIPLVEEGLRVLLDWSAGIELVSPTELEGTETARFRAFLDEHGEGVCSVVVRTEEVDGPIAAAGRHGAEVRYQQHREDGDVVLDEADLTPVFGMPVTLLATNRPD
jgi:4-hydroxyphenylpyruvate dioxygenase-like putative hemolysin